MRSVSAASALSLLLDAAEAVADAVARTPAWGEEGGRPGQYRVDQVADAAAVEVLTATGVGVLSEESGRHPGRHDLTVVLDPLDGSENAVRDVGPFGVSLCAVDHAGPLAAVVRNLQDGAVHSAVRGQGACRGGERIAVSTCVDVDLAVLALSGHPPGPLVAHTRALGAAALEMCAVADGTFDAFLHYGPDHHGCWDYLGALLVCLEAGAEARDVAGRDLVCLDLRARRAPLVAATPELMSGLRSTLAWVGGPGTDPVGVRAGPPLS